MTKRTCLYCYQELQQEPGDYHKRCSRIFFGSDEPPVLNYSLDEMKELAKNVVERSIAIPGVQPKLSLSLVAGTIDNGHKGRLTVVGALGGNYILKPPHADFPQMPENEHVTMRMAEAWGIPVVPSSLIRLASGELAYVTRRVDRRSDGGKIHMLDMFQVLEAFDKYKGSMERIGKAIATYSSRPGLDCSYFFQLALFCFLVGNNDMHLKNFSLLLAANEWQLAPAYDLLNVHLHLPKDKDELALTLDAKKSKLTRSLFEVFGIGLGLSARQVQNMMGRLGRLEPIGRQWLANSFLTSDNQEQYAALLQERLQRIIN